MKRCVKYAHSFRVVDLICRSKSRCFCLDLLNNLNCGLNCSWHIPCYVLAIPLVSTEAAGEHPHPLLKNFMKHTVTALLAASFCAFGMMAVAEKVTPSGSHEYGETMSRLILREQCTLSGLVLETKRGIAITTNRGTFLLKGVEIDTLVGKNVRVTGVIRDESIFAVKIDS